MKKQKLRILNFNKEKIASLHVINNLFGGSDNCGDPGGSNTHDKSEDVKKCPKPNSPSPNSGSPISCANCPPPDLTNGDTNC